MAGITTNTVFEIRSGGSDSNGGGGYDSTVTSPGTDYSQQTSAQYTVTGATSSGAGAILLTSSASADMNGNTLQITSGTNATTGIYTITSVSAGVSVTVNANCTTGAASAVAFKVGGCLQTLGKISAGTMVGGNKGWIKGTLTRASNDALTSAGSATAPITIEGYNVTRGDGWLGRTNNTGLLITTNCGVINYTGGAFGSNTGGNYWVFRNMVVTATYAFGSAFNLGTYSYAYGSSFNNTNTGASASGLSAAASTCVDCDMVTSGGASGSAINNTTGSLTNCHITAPNGTGVNGVGGLSIEGCLIYACGVTGISESSNFAPSNVTNTTIVNCGTGIKAASVSAFNGTFGVHGCLITDCSGAAIDCASQTGTTTFMTVEWTFFRNNNSGSSYTDIINNGGFAKEWQNTHKANSSAYVDYNNQSSGDYSLAPSSPAVGINQPYYTSPGCFQLRGGGVFRNPGMGGGMPG